MRFSSMYGLRVIYFECISGQVIICTGVDLGQLPDESNGSMISKFVSGKQIRLDGNNYGSLYLKNEKAVKK
jgi:hypothetical protein